LYFGYDDSVLDQPSKDAITAAVECYRRNGAPANLRLTGATDPRGTEEYNLALGERRAQSVRSYLVSLGVDGAKIQVSSVGQEMATGDDEEGWRRDRNVSPQ
jgi:peptidoglycan-associated lipoprotein